MNFLLSLFLTLTPLWSFVDLEEDLSPFVIETKRIVVPGYPHAFNASILPFQDSYLLIFRAGSYQDTPDSDFILNLIPGSKARKTDEMGLIFLSSNMEPQGEAQLLDIQHYHGLRAFQAQDPRLIEVGGHIYIVYSNMVENTESPIRRVFVTELFYDGIHFKAGEPTYLAHFEGCGEKRVEKNWAPFAYEGQLLLSYSLVPHRVFFPLLGSGDCVTMASSCSTPLWDYGELRGGTPALLDNGEYVGFFHSSKAIASKQSEGKKMVHYFMGAYTFSAKPPFALTRVSPRPIVGKDCYNGPSYTTWKPLRVIFPVGIISSEKYFWVTYGRQDHEIWVMKIDKKGLYKSLVSIY